MAGPSRPDPARPHEAADDAAAAAASVERSLARGWRGMLWLYVVAFAAGAALMGFELVGSRLLAPFFGNSIFVWGSLIGVFLGALSVGYTVGGRLSDRFPSAAALAVVLAGASVLVACVVLLAEPVQIAVVRWNPGIRLNPLISAIVLFGPASVLMGMVSPWAVRLAAADLRVVGATAGMLYGVSTMGSIVGTLVTAFWLIQAVGSGTVVLIIAVVLGACSLVCAIRAFTWKAMPASWGALIVSLTLLGTDTSLGGEQTTRYGNFSPVFRAGGYRAQFEPQAAGRVRLTRDSSYHRIRVVDYTRGVGAAGPTRVLHFDNSLQAGIVLDEQGRPDNSAPPLFHYLRAWDFIPVLRPDAERVLFIGLGSGAAPMRLRQLRPDIDIDVVEIDPEVVRVARVWFGYDDDAIDTHVGDGRSWLAASRTKYDVIVVDAYFADSIPFHLTTSEFLEVVDRHLVRDGLVVANMIGAVEGRRSELLRSMLKTYDEHFQGRIVMPVPDPQGRVSLDRFGNVELFAARGPLPDARALRAALEASPLANQLAGDPIVEGLLGAVYEQPISERGVPVLTDDFAPVDELISVEEDDAVDAGL